MICPQASACAFGRPVVCSAARESSAPRMSSVLIASAASTSRNSAARASARTSRVAPGSRASRAKEGRLRHKSIVAARGASRHGASRSSRTTQNLRWGAGTPAPSGMETLTARRGVASRDRPVERGRIWRDGSVGVADPLVSCASIDEPGQPRVRHLRGDASTRTLIWAATLFLGGSVNSARRYLLVSASVVSVLAWLAIAGAEAHSRSTDGVAAGRGSGVASSGPAPQLGGV